jgi:hypothetical protein
MLIYQSDIIQVHYQEARKQIELTCTGNINSRELKVCYRKALQFAEKNKVKHWLFDFSGHYQLTEEDQQWLDTCFFPNLMIALGPDNYIGMVVPKPTYKKMIEEAGQIGLQTYNSFIKLNTFTSSPKAARWLGSQTSTDNYFAL